ncbi:MAG TPA: S46 family peptidase [Thermoanaerobaculia bacterium]|nr:S46 family peptidase [Thermoanaerobaculia bacterium]
MNVRSGRLVLVSVLVLLAAGALADEGMWMPQQIPQLAPRLKEMGFQGDPQAFADLTGQPMGAIVSLGGCSASFVSPDGLIVTNNHCVQGALQYNSKPDRNLMVDGYLAKTRADELWNGPGSRVYVTVSVKEVTDEIAGRVDAKLTDRKRFDAIEQRVKAKTAECEKGGLRCSVSPFFEGLKWFELAQMEIQDVRLVYAPPAGIGNFGGETDNWQWPRHTGDWSFYRAYVSKDGKAVPFSKDNVPFKPKHWLKVSPAGANPGDLVFVAGYPGRTARLNPYEDVKETVEWTLPRSIRRSTDRIAILEKLGKDDKETALRVAQAIRGLNNGLTKNKGVLQGMVKGGLLADKERMEKDFVKWIDADAARKAKYGDVIPAINALTAERVKTRERNALLTELGGSGGMMVGSALGASQILYRYSIEKAKKDADRDPAYQERNWTRLRESQERAQRTLSPKADRALMAYALADVAKLPAEQRIDVLDKEIGLKPGMPEADAGKAIDAWLDRTIAGTKIYDKDFRMSLFEKSASDLVATKDSMVTLAAALYPLQEANREKSKEREGAMYRLGPRYAEALLAKNGGLVSPDANSTLRVTYGRVLGVPARDGLLYAPQTTLAGVAEKATGKGEFNAPKAQLDAIKALRAGKASPYVDPKLNDVPVNFLSTVDTTGGNSGSATLNARGELCGLLFDGTFDTVASDYLFDTARTRSIHVDSRYMLWTMAEVDGATNLLKEIGEAPSLDVKAAH